MRKFNDLSNMINNPDLEISIEKIKSGEYEIESVVDIITDDKLEEANIVNFNSEIKNDVKRGDVIHIVVLLRKKGSSSFSSPSTQAVLRCRIQEIYHGLSCLNKLIK